MKRYHLTYSCTSNSVREHSTTRKYQCNFTCFQWAFSNSLVSLNYGRSDTSRSILLSSIDLHEQDLYLVLGVHWFAGNRCVFSVFRIEKKTRKNKFLQFSNYCKVLGNELINLFQANVPFLYNLKISKKQRFCDALKKYRNETLSLNSVIHNDVVFAILK